MGGGGLKKLQRKDLEREQTLGESCECPCLVRPCEGYDFVILEVFCVALERRLIANTVKKQNLDCSFFRQDININVQTASIIWIGVVCIY